LDDEYDQGDHEQDVNQATDAGKLPPKQPKHEQDNKYCPEHKVPFG